MNQKKLTYKKISKKEIEEGILDDKFEISGDNSKPDNSSEIGTTSTSDQMAKKSGSLAQRWPTNVPFPAVIFEDIITDPIDSDSDIISTKHIENEELINAIETLVTLLNGLPNKNKNIFNSLKEIIENIDIENLPLEAKQLIIKKILNKNSKLIKEF